MYGYLSFSSFLLQYFIQNLTNYIKISIDISSMRRVEIVKDRLVLTDEVEVVYDKRVTPFGTSAKISVPKKHIGTRAYVVVLKELV